MHELSIAEELLQIIEKRASEEGIRSVERINLRIGEYSGIFPDSLEFAFEVLSKGKLTEGASVEVEMVSPKFLCGKCGDAVISQETNCPKCGSEDLTLQCGDELEIISFEGE
jgi:hydrogenase nickel incorporation protein HypA/HybF